MFVSTIYDTRLLINVTIHSNHSSNFIDAHDTHLTQFVTYSINNTYINNLISVVCLFHFNKLGTL